MKRFVRAAGIGCAALVAVELVFWLLVARHQLEGSAWVSLLAASLDRADEANRVSCVSVAPELFELTSERDRQRIRRILDEYEIPLAVSPPTRNPPTGYLDRECLEIFRAPELFEGLNLPLLATARIAYYTYDFNGDAVLMLQVGPRWIYIASWSAWI